jgi:hypothetical protein
MLNADTNLYAHHLGSGDFDFSKPAAQVVQHPTNPSIWGLKNLCDAKWVATMADGTAKDVEPGRSAPLANGVKVRFGKAEGEILY